VLRKHDLHCALSTRFPEDADDLLFAESASLYRGRGILLSILRQNSNFGTSIFWEQVKAVWMKLARPKVPVLPVFLEDADSHRVIGYATLVNKCSSYEPIYDIDSLWTE